MNKPCRVPRRHKAARAVLPIIFTAVLSLPAVASPPRPLSVTVGEEIGLPAPTTAFGVALASAGEEQFVLLTSPGAIVRLGPTSRLITDLSSQSSSTGELTDLTAGAKMELLAPNPWAHHLMRISRRGEVLPAVTLSTDPPLEPVSACLGQDGAIYMTHRGDGDLWRLPANGKPYPLQMSRSQGGPLYRPTKVEGVPVRDLVAVLDGQVLHLTTPTGRPTQSIALPLERPLGLAAFADEVWVVGDGLACVGTDPLQVLMSWPAESVPDAPPAPWADVLVLSDTTSLLLAQTPPRVVQLRIIRGSSQ